jgi:RHS repeat-associated protein
MDNSRAMLNRVRYFPFGSVRTQELAGGASSLLTDKLFTGQRRESANGVYDAPCPERRRREARLYDARMGRFLQPDPLVPEPGNPQSLNLYAYVLNNPLRYTDPTGMYPVGPDGEPLIPLSEYVPPAYIEAGVARLEALLRMEQFKSDGWLSGLAREGLGFLPVFGESEDIANIIGCSWVEERCGLPLWRRAAGAGALFVPFVGAGFFGRHADDAADLIRRNRARGLEAERILGAPEIKTALLHDGKRIYPDMFDADLGVLAEVKNVKYLVNTLQLRTYAEFARREGWTLALVVRQDTVLSKPLERAIAESGGSIQVFRVQGLP